MAIYDAFISYSHAKDKPIAAALQSAIQKLGKPWYRRRSLRVFRDDTSLSATPHLWPTIERALRESRFLILLASPEGAVSPWVTKEIAYWLKAKSADTLLIALTDGALAWDNRANDFTWYDGTSLPVVLRGRFAAEPKWVDLRPYRHGPDRASAKFTELAADFAAAVRGVPKEDLLSEEVRQQRRALTLAWGAAALLCILGISASAAGILAYKAQQEAVISEHRAISQREKALDNLVFAQERTGLLVLDIVEEVEKASALTADVKRRIADKAGEVFGQFNAEGNWRGWTEWHRIATMEEREGLIYLLLGDHEGALMAYRGSVRTRCKIANQDSGNEKRQREVLKGQRNVALAALILARGLASQGKIEEAVAAHRELLADTQALANRYGEIAEWEIELYDAFERAGDAFAEYGKTIEAVEAYRNAAIVADGLASINAHNIDWHERVSLLHKRMGNMQAVARQTY